MTRHFVYMCELFKWIWNIWQRYCHLFACLHVIRFIVSRMGWDWVPFLFSVLQFNVVQVRKSLLIINANAHEMGNLFKNTISHQQCLTRLHLKRCSSSTVLKFQGHLFYLHLSKDSAGKSVINVTLQSTVSGRFWMKCSFE